MTRLLAAVAVAVLTACSSGGGTTVDSPAPVVSTPQVLESGKGDVPLRGPWDSPLGFVPPLRLEVPAGWTSAHRGDDAFDLSRTDPGTDVPLVTVALVTPMDETVQQALAGLRAALGAVTPVTGRIGTTPATGFDVVGGSGPLLASPSGTLALDRAPGQHARLLGIDVEGVPLLAVVVVPDGARWAELLPLAETLLGGVQPG